MTAFLQSYLIAYVYWLSLPLGCTMLFLIHRLVGGEWGLVMRPWLMAGMRTFAWTALLFVPVLLGLTRLYPWATPVGLQQSHVFQHARLYLNPAFFIFRTIIYFVCWAGIAHIAQQRLRAKAGALNLGGPALIVMSLTGTFAIFDWIMSLEPGWDSTVFGLVYLTACLLTSTAFVVLGLLWKNSEHNIEQERHQTPSPIHDLGNLLLVFVMSWAYISFFQYLIVWAGNLPEESIWFVHRTTHGWSWFGIFEAAFGFAFPFLFLLFRGTKKRVSRLSIIAGILLVVRWLELYWLVEPSFEPSALRFPWLEILLWLLMGSLWIWSFMGQLKRVQSEGVVV